MKGSCVFWISAIYHQLPTYLKEQPILEDEDISDEVGCSCRLSLSLNEDENVNVKLVLHDTDVSFVLNYVESNSNGFMQLCPQCH